MSRKLENLRNIGVIAHIDAGKTTVTEWMLYLTGSKHRPGGVDKGTTQTDDDPEEQQRGITIYSACVTFDWKDVHINLLDTPGHVDFTAEVERCLRVLDGAVVVFSAREGVEAQSETVWRQANHYKVPRVAFINKMDREGANFEAVVEDMKERLQASPVPIQIPVGQGPSHVANPFRGVIDLIEMKMIEFDEAGTGTSMSITEIPEDMVAEAEMWREQMLDTLYTLSDEMMDLALEEKDVPNELIRKVLRQGTIDHAIQPLLCGSALHGMGVQPVLDAVASYLPSPLDRPPVEGINPKKKDAAELRKPSVKDPFCGIVFKILPAKTGDISWVRVYSGSLAANSRALNTGKDKKENIAQLWQINATKKEQQVPKVEVGDIVGVIGLRNSVTGDTLCDGKAPILLESITFPETVISMAIEPENATEKDKLADTLEMLKRQDPTLRVLEGETGQTLISGMGELHLEVIKNRLLRDFKLNVKFHKPQVSYRESISAATEMVGECTRQIGGQQLFAKIRLKLEPFPEGQAPVTLLNFCPIDQLPGEWMEVAMDELRARAEGGGLIQGFPLMKLKVSLVGAEVQEEVTDERAIRIAVNEAFNNGLEQGGKVLLEPVMKLDITTPEEYLGDFVGDLQQRRAIIAKTDAKGSMSFVEAHAPMSELFGYSSAMRSLSQGRAGCSIEPLEYSPAPPEVAKEYEF